MRSYRKLKSEPLSKETTELETKIKEFYGQKRGRAMIASCKQVVDMQLGSDNERIMEWVKIYEKELQSKL